MATNITPKSLHFKKTFNSKIKWIFCSLLIVSVAYAETYIFVSHSMNDSALQQYYKEAQAVGATLVMRGLIDNSFIKNKERAEFLRIGYDIHPELFEEYQVTVVPTIVKDADGWIQKITGHLPLREALKIFDEGS